MIRNSPILPDFGLSVNDLRAGAARECVHCGDMIAPGGELAGCTGRTDGGRLHEFRLHRADPFAGGPARECRYCGDMLTPDEAAGWCSAAPRWPMQHRLQVLEPSSAELPADYYARRDEVQVYVTAAAENLRRALAVITGEVPQLAYQVGGPLMMAERRVAGLRRVVDDAFGAAALDAAIIAGQLERDS